MPYYRSVGTVPRKRHVKAYDADGNRLAEELLGTEGFSRESALLYHRRSPSAILAADPVDAPRSGDAPASGSGVQVPSVSAGSAPRNGVGPRHFRTGALAARADLVTGRHRLLANADVTVAFARADGASPLYRSAVGDELLYVAEGSAVLESVFGTLTVGTGDYVVVPAGATHRWVPGDGGVAALVIESSGHVRIPDRYLTEHGQLVEGAPYSERDFRAPTEALLVEDEDVPVFVRTTSGWVCYRYATHPFDVVGWDGYLYPHAFAIGDFEPIVGRIHQPPPVHQTWALPGAVVCSFVPRPFDFDPDAVRVPYHHHNVDSDEILFYADGDFMSRAGSGIGEGSISYHPSGFVHGPQPGSSDRADATIGAGGSGGTGETAVMIDTFQPLQVLDAAVSVEDVDYLRSWV